MSRERQKLLHVMSACTVGGCEAHVLALLGALDRTRYEPWLAYFEERPDEARPMVADFQAIGVRTVDLKGRIQLDPVATWRLARLMQREAFDLVHTHSLRAELAAIAARLIRQPRSPVIRSVHNIDDYYQRQPAATLARLASRRVDHVIAISDAVARHLHTHARLVDKKLTRIHYGLDPTPFLAIPVVPTGRRPPTIGMIARLAPQKGHTTLLDALPAVIERVPDLRVEVVGHEHLSSIEELAGYARCRGVESHVSFLGYRDDVARALEKWDLLVLPSLWEGFGLVLLEAMAAGRPIVASRVGPVPEIVVHRETGLLVEPVRPGQLSAALIELLQQPEVRRRMGTAGRQRVVERFSLDQMVRETDALYERLLQRGRQGAASAAHS